MNNGSISLGGSNPNPSMSVSGSLPGVTSNGGGTSGNSLLNTGGGIPISGQLPSLNSGQTAAGFNPTASNNLITSNNALIQANTNSTANEQAAINQEVQQLIQEDAPGTAPSLNLNSINAAASANANSTVNPLYTTYLNQYLQNEAGNIAAAKQINAQNITGEQTSLQNTLAQNQLSQNAAANQNSLTQGNINTEQQNYQLQTGNAQTQKINAIAGTIGSGNLGASGIGQSQLYQAENARNAADAAQSGQYQYQRDTSNLSANDTFAQLAQSSAYATTAEGQQEQATNFNLNDYLRQAAANDQMYQESNAAAMQSADTAAEQNYVAQAVSSQIAGLNLSTKDQAAAAAKYAPYEQTTSMPSVSDVANLSNTYSTANYGSSV